MLFSCLERHNDGSFWYHGNTFNSHEQAEIFLKSWIPWDPNRKKLIIEHATPITTYFGVCYTYDFRKFEYGGITVCTI